MKYQMLRFMWRFKLNLDGIERDLRIICEIKFLHKKSFSEKSQKVETERNHKKQNTEIFSKRSEYS